MAKSDDYKNRLDTLTENKDATSLAKPDDDTKALQDNFANSDDQKGSWAQQTLSGQVVEVEMQQEQQQEQQQQQQQQNQQEQEKDRDDSGDIDDIDVPDEKRRDYKAVSEHLARELFKHDLMSTGGLSEEQAEEYVDKLDEVRDRETDKVVKKQYFRKVFSVSDSLTNNPKFITNKQLDYIVSLPTSSDNYQEKVVSYLEEEGKTVPDDLWQKLESKYDSLVESNKDSIAILAERALSEELPPHLKDIKFSKYKFSEHTTFSYREDYLSNKLASSYTDELVANGDMPGIKYLSEAALKQVEKDPDYFRNGVINNGKALSLPPGFVMGPVEPGSQSMILHYDSDKVKPMQQAQLEKASKDKSFHMMNHRSFEDNPENPAAQRLWSLENKKVHVGSSRVDNKFKGDLSERFFEENGTLKSGHNFAYFGEGNKADVEAIFKEKLEDLSDNIDKSMDNKKDRRVLKSYIYEAVLKNKTDLSAFLVGEELASLNSMIAMDKKDMQKFYTAVVVPNQMSPKVSSFGELKSSYEAYSEFIDSLNVSKEHKKKLYKVGYADSGKEDNTCRIRFDDPKVGLARLQYIVDKASDKTLQVDNIERIEVRSHDSAFQVKRNNADLPIITESFNTVSADRESLSAARLTPQERLKTVKEHSGYVSPLDNENTNKFDKNRKATNRLELSNKLKSFDAGFVTTVFSTMRTGNLQQLNMLGNAAYLVSFDNKGDDKDEKTKSTVAKDQNYAQDMAYNIGPYLNSLTRSGTNPDILLAHISSQIVQEKEGTKGEYELNPNVRSMGEIHAILSASITNKQEVENEAWHESKAVLVDSIISASASFEGEERRAFFAALRVTNEPEKFIETITQNALAENSQEKQSQIWQAAMTGEISQEGSQALSEDVLRELNDIHKVNKIKVTKGQGGQFDTFEIVKQDMRVIYDELATFSAEGADVSTIKDTIKKAGKDGEVDFSKSFTMDDQALVIQQRLLQDKGAEGIHDDLRNATKTEDVVKAIQKYETSRADAQKEIQDIQQNIETNIQAVNAILASITDGKFETKATVNDTLQQLEGILPLEIKEALKYKSGAEAELTEAQAQFVDDVNLYSLAKNPKAISRLVEYAAELQQDAELLQQKAGEYGEFTKTMNPQKQPLSMDDNFNHQKTFNNSHLLYDAIVTSKMHKLKEVNPQNKAELEKLSSQMEPKSFAMIAAKIETGVENKGPIDLMVASYDKKYEQNIESFVDKAYVVSSLQNKEERVAVMQRAMEQNIDVGQLKEIVGIANANQHLPAVEIMKLSEKGRNVGAEIDALEPLTTDKSKQAGVLEFSNHISRSIDRLNNDLSDTRTQDEKDKNLNQTAKSDDGKVQFWVKNKGIATLNAQEKEDFATVISKIQEIHPNAKPTESRALVDNLVKNKEQLPDLAQMYDRKELYANSEALNKALTKGEGAQDIELHTAPHGRRSEADIERQFNYDSALEKVNQFKSIESNSKEERVEQSIAKSSKQELLEDFLVVNNFGKDHVRHLDHKGLQALAQNCSERMQNDGLPPEEQKQARLEYLAVAREAHYRVDGKFAYSTQMLAIINNFEHGTHVVNEVQTGQGKSLISSITASALAASGCSVDVCTSNMDLARRDLEEQKKFFDYMGVNYSTEPIGQRSGADQYAHGGINYSTIPELSLYKQNMEVKAASEEQSAGQFKPQKTALVADEFDAAANMTTVMRLAQPIESLDKGEDSKYRIVYEAANKFIDNQNEKELAQKNIGELVDELKAAVEKGEQGKFGITYLKDFNNFVKRLDEYLEQEPSKRDEKLSELLTAAHQAKMLEEGKDFKVAEQEIEGKKYQTAKVLSGGMTTENVYSGGVHQCLHARLDDQRKANDQDKDKPKFVVNAESQVISSETVKNFMDRYDIINGYTGTHGHDAELSGYDKRIKAYQVPKHQEHNRKDREAQFAKGPEQQQQKINKFIDKLPGKSTEERQPILIVAENDAEAKKMYDAIVKARPNEQVQLVDSSKKDIELDTKAAGAKGMITISTSRMSRGTDIKPEHSKGLAVITTYADFRRVEGQIRGRSGRQDAQGVAVQILDENDLKKKLSESTGQEITKSGKKLLKEYHKHKEADNLKSVQDKQLEGDLRKAFVLMKQEEAREGAGNLNEIAQRRFNEVVESKTLETKEINVKEVEQALAQNNAPFVRELRSIAAKSESQLLEAELKEAYVKTEEKSGVNKEQAEKAFADKWEVAAADSKGNAEQIKETFLKDNPVLKEKLEEVQKEPEFAKKRSQQQLEDMEKAYIKAEPERHRVQTLKDANKEFSQAWKEAVADKGGSVNDAKQDILDKNPKLQEKLDVVTRANENKQSNAELQQEAKQTKKEKTSKLKKSDLKKAETKAEERSDHIVKQKKEPQANREPAQEEAKKWASAQIPKAEQGLASAARSQQQARSNVQGLDATSQVQMAEQNRPQGQGRNSQSNRGADPATLLQQSLDQQSKSTRVRKADPQKAAKQTVGTKPADITPKDKSLTELVVSGIKGMFALSKDNTATKAQDKQSSKEQKPAKKSKLNVRLARQAKQLGDQISQSKKQEQDLSRPPGLGQEVSQQPRGTSKNPESRDKSNLRIRPTSTPRNRNSARNSSRDR